jgi:hypothetical protein
MNKLKGFLKRINKYKFQNERIYENDKKIVLK